MITLNEKVDCPKEMVDIARYDILGVQVSAINLDLACKQIAEWIENRQKNYVCVVPVSTIVECRENKNYRDVVNAAGMATPDGMPVVWLARARGYSTVRRTYGPDLMLAACRAGDGKFIRHYFFGGTEKVLERLALRLKEKNPDLEIAGKLSPSFGEVSQEEDEKIVAAINQASPDVLWVGLGSPKQDFWMKEHQSRLNVPVMVGVGAAFDFLSGMKPQAPRWMQSAGLEWLFRLLSEPQRLWKRYLIGNTKFIYYLFCDFFKKKTA